MKHLTMSEVAAINETVMEEEGRQGLIINQGGLESALMRPVMAAQYEEADALRQAALLIAGLAANHPFIDGNKRTALLAGAVFLAINGLEIESEPEAFGRTIEALVQHAVDLDAFTEWLRVHTHPFAHK